jgi:soluble lytic murein transglycosylase-like protein
MRSREIAAFAGISLLITCCISKAYAVDISRLSSDELASARPTEIVISTKGAISQDEFVFRSSGELANSSGGNIVNITGDMSASMLSFSALTGVKSTPQEPTKTANIVYSNQTSHSVVPECGPSPLSPTEIEALVGATAAAYAIDPRFAKAIAWAESRYDQVRNSPKGARGPMQLMPSTATALGVQDPCEPKSNVDGGVRYLKALIDEFQNPLLAAAAYNAGSRAVHDNGGIPPYGETIRYVATVINYQLGIEPEQGKASPRRAIAMRDGGGSSAQASDDSSSRGSRFIKGVMHF